MTRVMIVEDQAMPRTLFEMIINDTPDFELAYSIKSSNLALLYCEKGDIDLILMDVCTDMDASGLEAAERIKGKFPEIKIIIVTSLPEFSWLKRARAIGVESFWYKNVSDAPLIEIMKRTMNGESLYPDETPSVTFGNATNHDFSYREMEILKELSTGSSNIEIGERLLISPNTVRNVIQNMLEKTGFKSRTELAVEARRLGIVAKKKEIL
ncbi:MAG: LuxR C-terminal-related transcriptional regulator [Candidatus Fimenecus sp.]